MALTTILPSGLNSANDFSSLVPAAYSQANASFLQANAAFTQANNSTDTWVRGTANDAFLQANSSYTAQNTTAAFANAAFVHANAAYAAANTGGGGSGADAWARDTANASFITANSGAAFANSAYAHANAAYAAANTGGGGGGADTWARAQANAAFSKANSEILIFAVTDDTSNVTVGASRTSFRAPSAMTLTAIPRASLNVASTSGLVTCDIKLNGTTILGSNKLSIDATEKTSTTAATPTTLVTTAISDDAEITVDITGAGTGAKGLKITLYYTD